MKLHKKGFSFSDMLPLGLTIVVLGIALSLGLTVLADFKADQVTATAGCGLNSTNGTGGTLLYNECGYAYNGTENAESGLDKFTSYLPTIALVIVVAIIISIIVKYLFTNV